MRRSGAPCGTRQSQNKVIGPGWAFFGDAAPLPSVKAGKLHAQAFTGANQNELLPDLPTMLEAMNPGFVLQPWYGSPVPADTTPRIIEKLNAKTVKILRHPWSTTRY